MLDNLEKDLLEKVAGIKDKPQGAYNIRLNSKAVDRASSKNITITKKEDKDGIDIRIAPGTKKEVCYIPVIMDKSGVNELVYNDFFIGDDCDVTIVAGCGIHNCGNADSEHDGIHAFYIGKNSKVKYLEKHYGSGDGDGKRIMNPTTIVEMDENSYMEMETTQIRGINSTKRITKGTVGKNSTLIVKEKLLTHGNQYAESDFEVNLDGENSHSNIISRAVAQEKSKQIFIAKINGNNKTVNLINEGEINILKKTGLTDIEFEAEIPQVKHPYAVYKNGFKEAGYFFDIFEGLKTGKKTFQFIWCR